jgi:hypothetical protein
MSNQASLDTLIKKQTNQEYVDSMKKLGFSFYENVKASEHGLYMKKLI